MQISILNERSNTRPPVANVATEIANDDGRTYGAFNTSNLSLFLGFVGTLVANEIRFINPFWGKPGNETELVPISKDEIAVELSEEAKAAGATISIEFNGASPRVRVGFPRKPPLPISVGVATIGFGGVWPMKGQYSCSHLNRSLRPVSKKLEQFGTVVQFQTAVRVLREIADEELARNEWNIQAVDDVSRQYTEDNLIGDLFDLVFERVGNGAATLKPNPPLPDHLTNSFESSQDGVFHRGVWLTLRG